MYSFNNTRRCNAFPNYVYLVENRYEEGKPSGSLEVPDRWHGDEKIVLDSESVYGLIVQGDEPIGEGVSIGMTYSQIKNVQGKIMMGYSGLAYTLINGKVWTLHFLLSDDEKKILDEKIRELTEGNGGLYYTTKIDLTELGLDPVCHAAYIYNTDNGLRTGESASEIIESLKQ
ncbi:hypothetical protein [Ruminococcus sp.]|uniref:hypothetical protein n=1 Tax=Ruminococcus sp. TaxID=41978 RepID=UPI00258A825E|nr:hypothetical protein [Ruminococcus sp.]MCR5020303.1 hypothetical protein [Ruminococcus sp.]